MLNNEDLHTLILQQKNIVDAEQGVNSYCQKVLQALHELKLRRECADYQKLAMRTNTKAADLCTAGLGLCGEAGEVADIIKKHKYHGHKLDKEHLKEELGDVCWYIALSCELLGLSMNNVMAANIQKLKKRYPNGFNTADSINRADEKGE